jgi:hypothetical protein
LTYRKGGHRAEFTKFDEQTITGDEAGKRSLNRPGPFDKRYFHTVSVALLRLAVSVGSAAGDPSDKFGWIWRSLIGATHITFAGKLHRVEAMSGNHGD